MSKFKTNQRVTIKESSSSKYRGKSGTVLRVSHVRHWGTGHDQYCILLDGSNKKINNLRDGSLDVSPAKVKNVIVDNTYAVVNMSGVDGMEFESDLMSKDEAMQEARSLQIMNPTCKFGIVQMLATTKPPRKVVDIEDFK